MRKIWKKKKIKKLLIRRNKKPKSIKTLILKIFLIFIFFIYAIISNFLIFKRPLTKIPKDELYLTTIKKNFTGRIFLCAPYNNEAEMLYIHVWRLYNYIDKFIFTIANITHSGLPKNFSLYPFEKEIQPYMGKIEFINFDNICDKKLYPDINIYWCIEKCQRDFAKYYLEQHYNISENDLIISVDIDEILTREGMEYILDHPPKTYYFIKGSMHFPYYYHKVEDWDKGCALRYSKSLKPLSHYRYIHLHDTILKYENNPLKPLITHCTYCLNNIEKYKNKLKSFAHQEYNREPFITNDWIFKSHYCRIKIRSPPGHDEPYEGWRHLIPDDKRLKFLVDPSFMYDLSQTNYTKKDLETLCGREYRRTPFE